jgi:hypothetical protein
VRQRIEQEEEKVGRPEGFSNIPFLWLWPSFLLFFL